MMNNLFEIHKNREVRIFISSTFRDMMNEREYLVKKVFPELRKKFKNRAVTITEVDLRWGVLEEEAENGKVIDICLTEIDKSRPYFIGLLGARYGWIPNETEFQKHKKIIENFGWVQNDVANKLSITEMEIQYGVLRNEQMYGRAFFYLRDDSNERSMVYKEEADSVEKEKLINLKRIITNSDKIKSANFFESEELGEKVFNDLSKIIEDDFPPLNEELKAVLPQLNFIKQKTEVYIPEEKYFKILNDHVKRTSSPIVVTGKTGAGKSALLANFLVEYSKQNPNAILLYNFSNASESASNHIQTLKRFCETLSGEKISFDSELHANPEKHLLEYLIELIELKVPEDVLLIIDGLDEYDNENDSLLLNWLPKNYPENTKVIYSVGPGKSLERLKTKRLETIYITEPEQEIKKEIIKTYLEKFSKKLSAEYINKIVEDDLSELSLTLRAFLDELRQFGVYEELGAQIDFYASANGQVEFYDKILQRLENDFEKNHEGLIAEVFTALYLVNSGLTETELLEILDIPQLYWTPVYNSIEDSLLNINGYLKLGHEYLRKAIEERYLVNTNFRNSICKKIIDKFDNRNADNRMIEETGNQLMISEDKVGLKNYLANLFNVMALFSDTPKKLLKYWNYLHPEFSPAEVYSIEKIIDFVEARDFTHTEVTSIFNLIGMIFQKLGDNESAKYFFEYTFDLCKKNMKESSPSLRGINQRLALLYINLNDYEKADEFTRRGVELANKYLQKSDSEYSAAIINRGLALSHAGDIKQAIEIYENLISNIDIENNDTYRDVLSNMASVYMKNNEFEKGINSAKTSLDLSIKKYGEDHPECIIELNNLGLIYLQIGKIKIGLEFIEKSFLQAQEIYGEFHNQTLGLKINLISALLDSSEYKKSKEILDEIELSISDRKYDDDFWGRFYNIKASYLNRIGENSKAIETQKMALNYFEKIDYKFHQNTIIAKKNLIQYLMQHNDIEAAENSANELLDHLKQKYKDESIELTELYNILGGVYRAKGDLDSSFEIIAKSLEIRQNILGANHPETIRNAHNLATILIDLDQIEDAKEFIGNLIEIIIDTLGKDDKQYFDALELMNEIYKKDKNWKLLEENLKLTYEFYLAKTGINLLTYNNFVRLIDAKEKLGYHEQADSMLAEALEMCKTIFGKDSVEYLYMLKDSGYQFSNHKKYSKAIKCYEEVYDRQLAEFGETNNELLHTLNNIASVHFLNNDIEKSREAFEKLLSAIDSIEGELDPEFISYFTNFAKLEMQVGNIEQAEKYYKYAFTKSIQKLGKSNKITIDSLYFLGQFYHQTERIDYELELYNSFIDSLNEDNLENDKAKYEVLGMMTNAVTATKERKGLVELLNKKLELSIKTFGINSVESFKTLVNLGIIYNIKADDKTAIQIINRIDSEIDQKTMLSSGSVFIENYNNLISCYKEKSTEKVPDENTILEIEKIKSELKLAEEQRNIDLILQLSMKYLELSENNYGANHPETVFAKKDFAAHLMNSNYYKEALQLLNEITEIIKNTLGETHHHYQTTIYSIAECQFQLQNYEDALRNFKSIKDQVLVDLENDHPFLYAIKRKIAETLFLMFKNDEAINYYKELLAFSLSVDEVDKVEIAFLKLRIGEVNLRLANYVDAINFLNEADLLYEILFDGKDNPYKIMIPELKGFILWKQADFDGAEKLYLSALNNSEIQMTKGHPAHIKLLKTVAKFYFENNRFTEATNKNIEILEIYTEQYAQKDSRIIEQKLIIALIYHNLEEHEKAIELLQNVANTKDAEVTEYSKKIFNNLYDFYK